MGRQFVTAGEGLLKVFWSQIVAVFTMGLTAFAVLLQSVPLIYLSALVMLAGQVLALLGLSEASIAHGGYRTALFAVVASLAAGLAQKFVKNAVAADLLNLAAMIGSVLMVYFICRSTADLLMEREEERLAEQGAALWKAYIGLLAASFICDVLAALFYGSLAAVVLAGVYLALQIGSTVMVQLFLFRSQRALRRR